MVKENKTEVIKTERKKISKEISLSPEDLELKQNMLSWVNDLHSIDESIHLNSLAKLKEQIQTGVISLTQLPKYLKFLHDKVEELKKIHTNWSDDYNPKRALSDIISALSLLDTNNLDCLKYRLSGNKEDLSKWGVEYVRHLAEEMRIDFENHRDESEVPGERNPEETNLMLEVAKFFMDNGYEIDAVDLCLDLDHHERLDDFLNEKNFDSICRYLSQSSSFCNKEDFLEINRFLYGVYLRFKKFIEGFVSALRALDVEFFHETLLKIVDEFKTFNIPIELARKIQLQMCLILAHAGIYYVFSEEFEVETNCDCSELTQIIQNKNLLRAHTDLSIELDILKPVSPDDLVRVSHLHVSSHNPYDHTDRSRLNMALAFVSGLANAAFQKDIQLLGDGTHKWLLSQKDTFLMNSIGCFGFLYMWDFDNSILFLDKFLNNPNSYIKAGAILAIGVSGTNVADPFMARFAILSEFVYSSDSFCSQKALMSMGLSYAGTDDPIVLEFLKGVMKSRHLSLNSRSIAAVSLGLVACGTNLPNSLYTVFIDLIESFNDKISISDPNVRFVSLGLGLLFVCRYEQIAQTVKALGKKPGNFGKWCLIMIKICSNIGSGNLNAIGKLLEYIYDPTDNMATYLPTQPLQSFLRSMNQITTDENNENLLTEPPEEEEEPEQVPNTDPVSNDVVDVDVTELTEKEKENKNDVGDDIYDQIEKNIKTQKDLEKEEVLRSKELISYEMVQGLATIGVALISMNDDIGFKMAFRLLNSFLQFGSIGVRRAVPIALSLISVSNPQIQIIELLSKLSHDSDDFVCFNAIIGLGVVAAGTSNARVAAMLRNLSNYYIKNPVTLFAIRLSQGLVHLSKGVMSLSPLRAEGTILSPVSISSLLIHSVMCLDIKNTYLSSDPHKFFWLAPAMKLRALITYDENFKVVPVTVKVGQSIEDPGQAGRQKRITGFQTFRTPILLNPGDHVELATERYEALSPILENIVLVQKKPGADDMDKD